MSSVDRALFKLAQRIREEFEETPGLRLTISEGAQFWGMDEDICRSVLARLLESGFLTKDADDRYRESVPAVDASAGALSSCLRSGAPILYI